MLRANTRNLKWTIRTFQSGHVVTAICPREATACGPVTSSDDAEARVQPVSDTSDDSVSSGQTVTVAFQSQPQRPKIAFPSYDPSSVRTDGLGYELTDADLAAWARNFGLEVEQVEAVALLESSNAGFYDDGRVKVRFESYWFQQLTNGAYDQSHPTLSDAGGCCYSDPSTPGWEWARVLEAMALDREAALESTSFGRFQVLGLDWELFGYRSIDEFVEGMNDETKHLEVFGAYIQAKDIRDDLANEDFLGFGSVYNPGDSSYGPRLEQAFIDVGGS